MSRLRRVGRWLLDHWAMSGLATAGGDRHSRTAHPMQTRFVADSVLPMVRDEDAQGERARAVWSVIGASALAGLGLLAIIASFTVAGPFALLLGAAEVVVAGAIVLTVLKRATHGSGVHLGGVVLACVSVIVALVAPTMVLSEWALAGLLLGIAAVVALVVGRR